MIKPFTRQALQPLLAPHPAPCISLFQPTHRRPPDAEQVAAWMVSLYPQHKYPAVMVGSSNGAAVHLCAALGIPWLPQTFLIPVARSGIHPDEPHADAEWAEKPARVLLEKNPDIQLHHMHDPVQDRLMIQRMTYCRPKPAATDKCGSWAFRSAG
ncbi:MAG TPA: hypothetical protein VGX03_18735 [Candidatus Binatia bacterium]|jgi:hypothetical protein|nr:hypothetical protein [Candidatus Binatia bacterium]